MPDLTGVGGRHAGEAASSVNQHGNLRFLQNLEGAAAQTYAAVVKAGVKTIDIDPILFRDFAQIDFNLVLAEVLARQQVDFYKPASSSTINGKNFDVESSYVVPLNQAQYRLHHLQ